MLTTRTGAPKDYEELQIHYRDFVERLVTKGGIAAQDVEDVASDIMTTFMRRGALDWYDPDKVHDTNSGKKTAVFATFLGGFVSLYLRAARDKQNLRKRREPYRLEHLAEGPTDLVPMTIMSQLGSKTVDYQSLNETELNEWVTQAYEMLKSRYCDRHLDEIFLATVELVVMDGTVSRRKLAEQLGITESIASRRFLEMRKILQEQGWRESLFAA